MAIEYLDHAADLGLRATGASLEESFCEAARGLFAVMVDLESVRPMATHRVRLEAVSDEDLLVAWLDELLAQKEVTGLVFSRFSVRIDHADNGVRLDGTASGERLDPARHRPHTEVKGITYLGLDVRRHGNQWTVECVLDV